MEPLSNKMKNYLPSKQFIARATIVAILLILSVGIYKISIFFKNRLSDKNQSNLIIKQDVIQKDSNDNTIPDWEESLWGLDPFGKGESNKEFILAQRKILAKENGAEVNSNQPLSENETLSREFFSVIMSLQQSGNLDETSIQAVSETIGQKVVAVPINDIYSRNMLLSIKTNPANIDTYYGDLATLFDKYQTKDIGKELTFISVGLTTSDPQAFAEASIIATDYKSFGKDLMEIEVPNTLANAHLSLANNYEKIGQSIEEMTKMLEDPFSGMKAVINYKKYTDALTVDFDRLSENL